MSTPARYSDIMTEQTAPPAEKQAPFGTESLITFRGRQMVVRFPTDAQLMVWKRTMRNLANAENESWDGEQALAALDRAGKIIDSVIVDRADREWLDDLTLDDGLTLVDRAEIIKLTITAFGAEGEDTKPAKRAPAKRTRRKA